MKRPELLLHLGLPKTATSSLQHNVFSLLHDDGRINFLGKCLSYDYKSGQVTTSNYRGKCIRDVAEGKLSVPDGRKLLDEMLDKDKLNVFSDEGIMVAYPGRDNLPLAEKFANLKALLTGYQVDVVVTLREPVDYLYSLYVQLYPEFCSKVRQVNSVEKYTRLLLDSPDNVLFESYHYKKWLPELEALFPVSVVEYEQLKDVSSSFYRQWSCLLGMSEAEFEAALNKEEVNAKKKLGKEVEVLKDFKGVELYFYNLLANSGFIFNAVRRIYQVLGIKKLLHYRFGTRSTHKYPSGDLLKKLKKALEFGSYRYDE